MKIALCCIIKNENKYFDEFINHYLNFLKFDHIFIYDHNDPEGEVIKDYGENVTIINFRGKPRPCQDLAYMDCYKNYLKNSEYDWCLFIDADEYLYIPETNNDVKQFLELEKFKDADEILINWVNIQDNNLIRYDNRKLCERFKDAEAWMDKGNRHTKPFLRCTSDVTSFRCPHVFFISSKKYCNTAGVLKRGHAGLDSKFLENHKYAYLKHYTTKTIEEFLWKIDRGFPDGAKTSLNNFFGLNEDTPEKRDFIKKYYEKNINENKIN